MKHLLKFLSAFVVVTFLATSCQQEEGTSSQLTETNPLTAENESAIESAFEDIDDIGFESFFYIASGERIEATKDSPMHCAPRSHNKEN